MSMYFELGDETLWNPSNGADRLFLRQAEVFEKELGLPSGIGQGRHRDDPDTREVDPAVYGSGPGGGAESGTAGGSAGCRGAIGGRGGRGGG
jgi:hypothetical protein